MIYFFNANMGLKKIVNSENVVSAVHEHELNGVILSAIALDLSYARVFKDDVEYFGYYYKNNFYIHKIRRVEEEHNNETLIFIGRHIFFDELMTGELVQDVRPVERDAVYTANATIGNTTRWKPFGNSTTKHLSSNFYWELPIEVLNTIVEQFQVEYLPIIEFDGKKITDTKLRIDERIGKDSGIRIPYGSRVLSLKYDIDYEQIITKLFVQGRGEEVGDGYGRRINIKELNFSKDSVVSPTGVFYLYDQSLIDEYGVRHGKEIFEDIEDVNELAQAGYDYYIENSRPKMLFTAEVAQIGDVSIGDTVNIIRREYDIYFKARIHKITVNLLNQSDASVELGDYEHFKESKAERIERKKNEVAKSETNNRIESLKRQFDTEFDSQVEEFRKEFEQKLIDVSAEIVADQERMENEMSQMKLEQQQRVDEIYEDIGGINQTVSDVANKTDYLDGVYTDLSTQTGEVSSTVANIIDGNAPAGSVLKQTIDGVVGRVWEQDIDNLKISGRNLISRSDVYAIKERYDLPLVNNYILTSNTDYAFSVDIELRNVSSGAQNRVGAEIRVDYVDGTSKWYGVWYDLPTANHTTYRRITSTFKTDDKHIVSVSKVILHAELVTGTTHNVGRPMLEIANKPSEWSSAPEDNLKHTDLVLRPDGFLLGSFEMGGDKIAQAIVGKAGAIDLIANNVNLSNNLNVANQIKSLSLETVYANISELRTRMLVADAITANMVKFDTALIEKFTSSTAFINSLTAKSAFINNVKAIDITASRITSELNGNFTTITGGRFWSTGSFTRRFNDNRLAYYTTQATSENGVFSIFTLNKTDANGESLLDSDWTSRGMYLHDKGLGTQRDNFANSRNQSGRYIDFFSDELYDSGYRYSGMKIHSDSRLYLQTLGSSIVLDSDQSVEVQSKKSSIFLRPRQDILGDNTFQFYVLDEAMSDGLLAYGSTVNGMGVILRFSKNPNDPKLTILNAKDWSKGTIDVNQVDTWGLRTNSITNAQGSSSLYLGVGGAELAVTDNNLSNNGSPTYMPIRANRIFVRSVRPNGLNELYLQTYGNGEVRITPADITSSYRDIRYRTAFEMSHEDYKTDIQEWNTSVLDIFRNHLKLNKFKVKDEVETKYARYHHGIVLRRDSNLDTFPVEWRHKDGYDSGEVMWWAVKGVQELAYENDELKSEIAELKSQINKIMEMIA